MSEAAAIYATLRAWRGEVTTVVVGRALSAMILMAGARRLAGETSLLMMHVPWTSAAGNAQGLRQRADALDQVAETMRTAYRRSGQPDSVIASMAEIQAACLDDPSVEAAEAGKRILAQLAKGVTPACSWHYTPDMDTMSTDRMANFRAAATDVLLMRAGMRVAEPHPAARDLHRTSILGMAEMACSMSGLATSGLSPSGVVKAALSTSDFPLLLSNTATKSLLIGYEQAPSTHTVWTSQREVRDFKTQTLLVLSETPDLEAVAEYAEDTHGALSEAAETFAIGKIISLSRKALINDDLSAFTTLPEKFGAAARRLEADKVYGRLTANPLMSDGVALFHATHGNLAAAGGALSVTTLGAARAAMRKQKGIARKSFIDPQPRYLITPVALETAAEQLLASLVDPSKSNDTTNPSWIRGLTLVSDPRLDADSTTAWYLAASPQQIEGVARAYLQGETEPQIETDEGFEIDAVRWKVRHEFAATVVGWRALYKNPGA